MTSADSPPPPRRLGIFQYIDPRVFCFLKATNSSRCKLETGDSGRGGLSVDIFFTDSWNALLLSWTWIYRTCLIIGRVCGDFFCVPPRLTLKFLVPFYFPALCLLAPLCPSIVRNGSNWVSNKRHKTSPRRWLVSSHKFLSLPSQRGGLAMPLIQFLNLSMVH
jgi:hypothetical protein